MEYSIQELSRLAGVTTRTLRWYDQIGLLKPSRIAESGYRYYGSKEVDRLQDILFYRALGVELAQIRECLDAPSFDRLSVLRGHLSALEARLAETEDLIQAVRNTIKAEERDEMMADEKKFEAFKRRVVDENEKSFGEEARLLYGDQAVDEARNSVMNLTQEQYKEWTELNEQILKCLEEAVAAHMSPYDKEGEKITKLHRRWLMFSGVRYSEIMHKGIAELYVMDDRFTAYYDRKISGCAQFLHDAILHWVEK